MVQSLLFADEPDPPGEDDLPFDDGVPVDSDVHACIDAIVVDGLDRAFVDEPDVYVASDLGIYTSVLERSGPIHRAPDVFVVRGTVRRMRKSWVMWREGRGPSFVLEVISPSTEAQDRGPKMAFYATVLRVPEYFLFDPATSNLEAYRLDARRGRYVRMRAGRDGRVRSLVLGLTFGVVRGVFRGYEADWLRVFRPDGSMIPTSEELAASEAARAEAEAARAVDQAARAEAEAARAEEAEAEIARLRAALEALRR